MTEKISPEPDLSLHPGRQGQSGAYPDWKDIFDDISGSDWENDLNKDVHFRYASRNVTGKMLHLVCVNRDAPGPVKDSIGTLPPPAVNELCRSDGWGHFGVMLPPLHLAAGSSNIDCIRSLLKARADIDACSKFEGHKHATALHEAIMFDQIEAARTFLDRGANVNANDYNDYSPLHWAAKRGSVEMIKLLLDCEAERSAMSLPATISSKGFGGVNIVKRTPLMVALEAGALPHQCLHLLAERSMDELLSVAMESQRAAYRLLVDKKKQQLRPGWAKGLRREANAALNIESEHVSATSFSGMATNGEESSAITKQWLDLLECAPEAAAVVLEVLTVEPEVESTVDYRLPSKVLLKGWLRCHYGPKEKWSMDYTDPAHPVPPDWHGRFAPTMRKRHKKLANRLTATEEADWERVKFKIVLLPHILSAHGLRTFYLLSNTKHQRILTKLAVRGIIKYVWRRMGIRCFYNHLLIRFLELVNLVLVVADLPRTSKFWSDHDTWFYKFTWGIEFVCASRELFFEAGELVKYVARLGGPWDYLSSSKNLADLTNSSLLLVNLILVWHDYRLKDEKQLLSFVIFSRWCRFLYIWRCHPKGSKILSMVRSFPPMSIMMVIMAVAFLGFFHTYMALEVDQSETVWKKVFVNAFRFLFLGDGNGVDEVLALDGSDVIFGSEYTFFLLLMGVVIFSLCMLNLFIAVNGEAYDQAQETATLHLRQAHAEICFECLMRPRLPPLLRLPRRWVSPVSVGFRVVAGIVFGLLCTIRSLHPVVPGIIFLFAWLYLEAVLQQPYKRVPAHGSVLWICHRADLDESYEWPGDEPIDMGTDEQDQRAEEGVAQKPENAEDAEDGDELSIKQAGRIASIKHDNSLRSRRLENKVMAGFDQLQKLFACASPPPPRTPWDQPRKAPVETVPWLGAESKFLQSADQPLAERLTSVGAKADALASQLQTFVAWTNRQRIDDDLHRTAIVENFHEDSRGADVQVLDEDEHTASRSLPVVSPGSASESCHEMELRAEMSELRRRVAFLESAKGQKELRYQIEGLEATMQQLHASMVAMQLQQQQEKDAGVLSPTSDTASRTIRLQRRPSEESC